MTKAIFYLIFVYMHKVQCDFQHIAKPCQLPLPCSEKEEVAFATEGERCHIFLNSCTLRNENCLRHNVYFKTLTPITAVECKTMCNRPCSEVGVPFCGTFGTGTRTFVSFCEWNRKMCETGHYFKVVHTGPCEQDLFIKKVEVKKAKENRDEDLDADENDADADES